jgi:serine/threonine-protein kinase RsbW
MHSYGKTNHREVAMVHFRLLNDAQQFQVHAWAEMRPVFESLEAWMRFLGYPRRDLFALTLALHEAATNALRHGNRNDQSKPVRITYVITSAEVLVEVQDQGRGFDPDQVADPLTEGNLDRPGGRGLFLMRAYCSWVSFNAEGNQVTLCKRRSDL